MGERLQQSEQSGNLGTDLLTQQALAEKEASSAMDKKIGWIEKNADQNGGSVRLQYDAVYRAKAQELTKELLTLRSQLDSKYIMKMQNVILNSLQRRATLSMELVQKRAEPTDIHTKISQGINLLQSANIPSLVYQHLQSKDSQMAESYLKGIEYRCIANVPNIEPVLEALKRGEITDKEWKVIVEVVKVIGEDNRDWLKDGTATTLMALIPQNKRTTFVGKMLAEANYQEVLKTLVISGYLEVPQVTEAVEAKIKKLDQTKDVAKIKELQEFSLFVDGKELARAQQQVEVAKVHEIKKHPRGRRFGQSNNARQLLTWKGLGGTLLAFNGMATIAANVLMNIDKPSQLLKNKSLAIGLAMTVGGLELSNGMGGMIDKPSTNLAQGVQQLDEAMGGRKTQRDQMQEVYSDSFEHDILRHSKANKLYFQFAPEINAAYNAKVLKTHSSSVKLTVEEMGLNWKQIQKDFEPIDKSEVETYFSQWVSRMGKKGTSWKSWESQQEFIGSEIRKKHELTPYEEWNQEKKRSYLASVEPAPNK